MLDAPAPPPLPANARPLAVLGVAPVAAPAVLQPVPAEPPAPAAAPIFVPLVPLLGAAPSSPGLAATPPLPLAGADSAPLRSRRTLPLQAAIGITATGIAHPARERPADDNHGRKVPQAFGIAAGGRVIG